MKFNVFEQITKPWPRVTLHNVHLLAAHPTGDSFTMITVEHQGAQCDLISANRWDAFIITDIPRKRKREDRLSQ